MRWRAFHGPCSEDPQYLRSIELQSVGKFAEALALYTDEGLSPSDACWDYGLNNALLRRGDVERAATLSEAAVQEHPGSTHLRVLLASAYNELGRAAEADELLQSELTRVAQPHLRHFILHKMTNVYEARGEYQRSAEAYARLIEGDPMSGWKLEALGAEAVFGDHAGSLAKYTKLSGLDQHDSCLGRTALVSAAYAAGEDAAAREHIDILFDHCDAAFDYDIGRSSVRLNYRMRDAIERLVSRARAPIPAFDFVLAGLRAGLSGDLRTAEQFAAGWREYNRAEKHVLADILVSLGSPAAIPILEFLLSMYPSHPYVNYLLGRALKNAHRSGFEAHFDLATQACPANKRFAGMP